MLGPRCSPSATTVSRLRYSTERSAYLNEKTAHVRKFPHRGAAELLDAHDPFRAAAAPSPSSAGAPASAIGGHATVAAAAARDAQL